jgi:hypothetical protein
VKNHAPDGTPMASMDEAMKAVMRYVELAETHRGEKVSGEIENDMLGFPEYANQAILGCVMLLASFKYASGRSMVPVIRAASRRWTTTPAEMRGIWTP